MRLPARPSAGQLRRALSLGFRGAFTVDGPSPEMPFLNSFLTGSEILGQPVDPSRIRQRFSQMNWDATFKVLAVIAATLGRQGILGKAQKALMTGLASQHEVHPGYALIATRLPPHI